MTDLTDVPQVGGLPTRFHYTSVAPQKFGLNPVEILLAKDSELNEYMSVKKYAPYRADNKVGWDKTRNERLREFKGKVQERMGGLDVVQSGHDGEVKKKRKGKKERMREKGVEAEGASETAKVETNGAGEKDLKRKRDAEDTVVTEEPPEGGKKKRRRKKKDSGVEA